MHVKMFGLLLLFIGSTGLGLTAAASLSERRRTLQELEKLLLLLHGEIRYGGSSLPESLRRIQGKLSPPWTEFVKALAEMMEKREGRQVQEIFREVSETTLKNSALHREDLNFLKELGGQLGFLDRKNQLQQLERFEKDLQRKILELQEELPQKKKLFQTLGIIGGLFLTLILL